MDKLINKIYDGVEYKYTKKKVMEKTCYIQKISMIWTMEEETN